MIRLLDALRRRGALTSWPSVARVGVWVVVWTLALSGIVAPHLDGAARDHEPDVPASEVAYAGPTSRSDFAGFLPTPTGDRPDSADTFDVAWVGGSEIKLRQVSLAASVERRLGTVADQPVRTEVFSLIAPRIIDVIRAVDAVAETDVDAVVVALNPSWTRSDLPVRGWPNLDVANLGSLWRSPSTLAWAAALTSPDDIAWRLARAAFPLVDGQFELNQRLEERLDTLDLIDDPVDPEPVELDPRLPTGDTFWLVQEHGTDIVGDPPARVEALMRGTGESTRPARALVDELFDRLAGLDAPVYAYISPLNPDLLADPGFDDASRGVEAFWAAVAADLDVPHLDLDTDMWSRDEPSAFGVFSDTIHFSDPEPFAEFLAARLCLQWRRLDREDICR